MTPGRLQLPPLAPAEAVYSSGATSLYYRLSILFVLCNVSWCSCLRHAATMTRYAGSKCNHE
jgi:hypothetical protein